MLKVIPLRCGTIFKKASRDPMVFSRFASDVLGMPIEIAVVHQEFRYDTPVGQVKVEYDLFGEDVARRAIVEVQHIREPDFFDRFAHYHLVSIVEQAQSHEQYRVERDVFTLVVLTTAPRGRELQFSVAVSDMDPINEQGQRLGVYRHRLVFLNPKVINAQTPPGVRVAGAHRRLARRRGGRDALPRPRAPARGEGRAEGVRRSLLTVLAARGLSLSEEERARRGDAGGRDAGGVAPRRDHGGGGGRRAAVGASDARGRGVRRPPASVRRRSVGRPTGDGPTSDARGGGRRTPGG